MDFTSPGTLTMFTVPAGVTSVYVIATGASGSPGPAGGGPGGPGALVAGDLAVTPGQDLWIAVGALGDGGAGDVNPGTPLPADAGDGGGSSDVRTDMSALSSRVIVAAGGGGGGGDGYTSDSSPTGQGAGGGAAGAFGSTGSGAGPAGPGERGGPGGAGAGGSLGHGGAPGGHNGSAGAELDGGDGGDLGGGGANIGGGGGGGGDGWYGGGGGGGGGGVTAPLGGSGAAGGGGGGGGSNHTGPGVTDVFEGAGPAGVVPGSVELNWSDPQPSFDVSPASKSFGAVPLGSASAPQTFTVTNTGDDGSELEIASAGKAGADPGQFSIDSDDCTGATLAADESCKVRARFAPTTLGAKAAALRFVDGSTGAQHDVPLSGTATPQQQPQPKEPDNEFEVGKAKGKKVPVTVPGAGEIDVRDAADTGSDRAGAAKKKQGLKPSTATASGAGTFDVALKLTKPAKKKLKRKEKVKLYAIITFTPLGGTANEQSSKLKVEKKK